MSDNAWIRELATERYNTVVKTNKAEIEDVVQVIEGIKNGEQEVKRGRTVKSKELKGMEEYLESLIKRLEIIDSEDFKSFYIDRVIANMNDMSPFTLNYVKSMREADKELARAEDALYGDIESYITVSTGSFKLDA